MSKSTTTLALALAATLFALASNARALPTKIAHVNTPDCDDLFIPEDVHEIGHFLEFPGTDEDLASANLGQTADPPCPASHIGTANFIIDIRNLTGKDWLEVWYVADSETTITNFDGEANDIGFPPLQEAFRIDNMVSDPGGSHHPLIAESMNPDGIWEAGESWQFILQDYSNTLGLPPEALTSLGVGSASTTPTMVTDAAGNALLSSGSIIAIEVPEPATCVLMAIGFAAAAFRRR